MMKNLMEIVKFEQVRSDVKGHYIIEGYIKFGSCRMTHDAELECFDGTFNNERSRVMLDMNHYVNGDQIKFLTEIGAMVSTATDASVCEHIRNLINARIDELDAMALLPKEHLKSEEHDKKIIAMCEAEHEINAIIEGKELNG